MSNGKRTCRFKVFSEGGELASEPISEEGFQNARRAARSSPYGASLTFECATEGEYFTDTHGRITLMLCDKDGCVDNTPYTSCLSIHKDNVRHNRYKGDFKPVKCDPKKAYWEFQQTEVFAGVVRRKPKRRRFTRVKRGGKRKPRRG